MPIFWGITSELPVVLRPGKPCHSSGCSAGLGLAEVRVDAFCLGPGTCTDLNTIY